MSMDEVVTLNDQSKADATTASVTGLVGLSNVVPLFAARFLAASESSTISANIGSLTVEAASQ